MRSTVFVLAAAAFLAGCSMVPFAGGDDDAPVTQAPAATATTAEAQVFEIKNADRGLVRRVAVLLNGRTVDTLVMSRTREMATSHCCTADGCEEIQSGAACTAFKMTCDKDGVCSPHTALSRKKS